MNIKRLLIMFLFANLVIALFSQEDESPDEFYDIRKDLVDSLFTENDQAYREIKDAFLIVRRDLFIDSKYQTIAYKNMPVPAKNGLIHPSPEFIATLLKNALISPLDKVLVIGRNSQYLNRLILELTENLYVIDPGLNLLPDVNYENKKDMSYFGWVEQAPFDIIILFGSVEEIPQSLVSQLRVNGKLIFPLSFNKGNQILTSARRFNNGFEIKSIGDSYIHRLR